jgi:hypothetical protein
MMDCIPIDFPANAAAYEAEFKRAQNEDRRVIVAYTILKGDTQIIELWVYAGTSDPGSNKR